MRKLGEFGEVRRLADNPEPSPDG